MQVLKNISSGRKSRSFSFSFPDFINVGLASVFPCRTPSRTLVLHLIAIWPWKPRSPMWYAQLTLNSVALVPFVIFCPQMLQRLLSLPLLSHVFVIATLLFGCPQYLLNKLQKVQNNAARLVPRVSKTDHISPHLAYLHWLPIDSRI